jgi:hypothetical protein
MNYDSAARSLGVEVALIHAVADVESRGAGFNEDRQPKILFERHVFYRRIKAKELDADGYASKLPNICNPQPGGYEGGAAEYTRMELAAFIDYECAYESASWGAFQIMGFQWKALGYLSIDDMVLEMHESEDKHLDCFVRFIRANPPLLRALKSKNFAAFASGYNGEGYQRFKYDTKMADAYGRYRNVPA